MKWLLFFFAIVGEVVGTTSLKLSNGFTRFWPSVFVIVGYALSFYLFALTLKVIPVGIGYAIWSGIGIVLISIIGHYFFKQHLDLAAYLGITLILAGVLVIQLFSKSVAE
jgi:small multidrug resistance pump